MRKPASPTNYPPSPRARAAAPLAASVTAGQPLTMLPLAAAPTESEMLLAGLLAGLTVALLYAGFVLPRFKRHLHLRLATYLGGQTVPSDRRGVETSLRPLQLRHGQVSPLTALAARLSARLLPRRQLGQVRRYLAQAGLQTERHLRLFLATRLALAMLLGGLGYGLVLARAPERALMMGLVLAGLGFYLPGIWLKRRIQVRQRALLRALPDALDLMSIGVSAGLSLDSVMVEVVQRWDSELSRELNQVLTELRLGTIRRQALLNLVERTQLEDLRLLVVVLIQADELGTSLTETLAVQAVQLRIRRRQYAEELARKAPIKMLFPMIFLIFPALFVVLLGPAGLQFISAMQSLIRHGPSVEASCLLRGGGRLRVTNATRGVLLAARVELAATPWRRLRGLLGHPPLQPGDGLLITPCIGIHTMGMTYPIDVIHLDRGLVVRKVLRELKPWRQGPLVWCAHLALDGRRRGRYNG